MAEFSITSMQFNSRSHSITGTFRITGHDAVQAADKMTNGQEMPAPPSRVLTKAADDLLEAALSGTIATAFDAVCFVRERAAQQEAEK